MGTEIIAIHTLTSRGSLRFFPLVHPWKEELCDMGLEGIQPMAEDGIKELQWNYKFILISPLCVIYFFYSQLSFGRPCLW